MTARATTLLILTLAVTASVACTAADDDLRSCTPEECAPSYRVHLESPEPDLEVGLWRVDLDIDGATVSAECMVTGPNDGPESLPCEVGDWTVEPDRPISVSLSVNSRITEPGSGEPTDTGDPPEFSNQGIFVNVVSDSDEAPLQTLEMVVSFEDAVVLEAQRAHTFEVIEDFGGPGCGTCLRDIEEAIALP